MVKKIPGGVLVPLLTPFSSSDFAVDKQALIRLVEYCQKGGVDALIPTGSTGEFTRLSIEEMRLVISTVVEHSKVPVIAGTGAAGTLQALELSQFASDIGATAVQVVAPYYGHPTDLEIERHYREIATRTNIPVIVYNNPAACGYSMSPELIARICTIPGIAGVKDSDPETRRIRQIVRSTNGQVPVFDGSDDNIFEAFLSGASGWVSGIANVIPSMCVEFTKLIMQKDLVKAREIYEKFFPLSEAEESGGRYIQCLKAALNILGLDVGSPRPPLVSYDNSEIENLRRILAGLGVRVAQTAVA